MGQTLAEKVWADHLVRKGQGSEPDLIYIDLQLMHEVTSPQAFEGLRLAGRGIRHVDQVIATEDHNTPTVDIDRPIADKVSALQISTLEKNCKEFGVRLHPLGDADQGIVHAFAPILGLTQPGMTIVCGDSHTSTHGAFGALAFGIGTSEVEHVLATQTLSLKPFKTMAINVEGKLPEGVSAKDIILAIIAKIGTGGGQGYVLEYRGQAIRDLSMDARMTICNMSIEAGARAGMIAPDQTTFDYLRGRPHAPEGEMWDKAMEYWKTLKTDDDAVFDAEVTLNASDLSPYVTWGTNPGQGLPINSQVPVPEDIADAAKRQATQEAIDYMPSGRLFLRRRGRYEVLPTLPRRRLLRPSPRSEQTSRSIRSRSESLPAQKSASSRAKPERSISRPARQDRVSLLVLGAQASRPFPAIPTRRSWPASRSARASPQCRPARRWRSRSTRPKSG